MVGWALAGCLFWLVYILAVEIEFTVLYYYFILFAVGLPLYFNRVKISSRLRAWKLGGFWKFMILGYGTVLFEETFAALFNHLNEGFEVGIFVTRIGQFWLLNLFAFTGFYLAFYFMIKRYKFSHTEIFFLAGPLGIFLERIFTNPMLLLTLGPIMIFVYGFMISLPMLSMDVNRGKVVNRWWKYFIVYVAIILASIIPGAIMGYLREINPLWFPPADMVSF